MICVNVEQILKKQKKSKYWFVKNMGSSYQSLSNMMNNQTSGIYFETLDKICEILDCEPGDVLVRKREKRKKVTKDEQTTKAVWRTKEKG